MFNNMILQMGHPALRRKADKVTHPQDKDIQRLITLMKDVVENEPAAGLAAPQLGALYRIVIVQVHPHTAQRKGIAPVPPMVLLNPRLKPLSRRTYEDWEGCLSLEGLMGLVPRFERIAYHGLDEKGNVCEGEADGHFARTLQHEVDHLEGILYIDRMKNLKNLIFRDQYENWLSGTLGT